MYARITRATADSVTGVPLPAGQRWTLAGRDPRGLVGIPQNWPLVLPRLHPRREELMVLVTGSPTDLGVLESSQRAARAGLPADAGSLARLCTQLHVGGSRGALATVEEGYVLVRLGFWVDPTEPPRGS